MQIISGKYKGRKLVAPKGTETRPTLARVKESVFSVLGDKVRGARVLDVFAGSGAYGVECASRGSESVVLIDQSKEAALAIQKNFKDIPYQLLSLSVVHALTRLGRQRQQFDLIFMDPPYQSTLGFDALRVILKYGLLATNGVVVYESPSNQLPNLPKGVNIVDVRQYGIAQVSFLKQKMEQENE